MGRNNSAGVPEKCPVNAQAVPGSQLGTTYSDLHKINSLYCDGNTQQGHQATRTEMLDSNFSKMHNKEQFQTKLFVNDQLCLIVVPQYKWVFENGNGLKCIHSIIL